MVEVYLEELDFAATDPVERAEMAGTEGLVEAMRHSLLAGGKRIRPVLALATGREPRRAARAAAARRRRPRARAHLLADPRRPARPWTTTTCAAGGPTCHVLYGEDTAILAGDALFAEAVRLVAERQPGGAAVRVGILLELSRATGVGRHGGRPVPRPEGRTAASRPAALRRVHALKTGRLIAVRGPLRPGARPARSPTVDAALRVFARELGLLFQIVDDILDVEGSEADLGKAVGADARRGKVTYVSVHGIEGARRLAGEAHSRALEALAALPGPTDDLVGIADLTFARHH